VPPDELGPGSVPIGCWIGDTGDGVGFSPLFLEPDTSSHKDVNAPPIAFPIADNPLAIPPNIFPKKDFPSGSARLMGSLRL
jgi:hypothetical protein